MKRTLTATTAALLASLSFADGDADLNLRDLDMNLQIKQSTRTPLRTAKTVWGPTGLIFVPSAYTIKSKDFSFGAALTKDFASATAGYGIVDDVEIGVAYIDRNGSQDKAIANAKVHIVPSNFDWFEIGVGIMDAADAIEQTFYAVGSADLVTPDYAAQRGAVGLRVHAGVGTGYFSEKPFAGGELLFDKGFSLVGEWDTKNANFAVRYAHDDEFFVEIGNFASRAMFKMSYHMRF